MRVIYDKDPNFEPIIISEQGDECYNINDPNLPSLLLNECLARKERIRAFEPIIAKGSPYTAFTYADEVANRERIPIFEHLFLRSPEWAYAYAASNVKGPWPEAEECIIKNKDAEYSFFYARDILKRRWPETEPIIMKKSRWAYEYTKKLIKKRWPEAEPFILLNPKWAFCYARDIIGDRWPLEIEEKYIIKKSRTVAREYQKYPWEHYRKH